MTWGRSSSTCGHADPHQIENLLPRDPALGEDRAADDPRQELVDRLLEHERFKNAAEMLQQNG